MATKNKWQNDTPAPGSRVEAKKQRISEAGNNFFLIDDHRLKMVYDQAIQRFPNAQLSLTGDERNFKEPSPYLLVPATTANEKICDTICDMMSDIPVYEVNRRHALQAGFDLSKATRDNTVGFALSEHRVRNNGRVTRQFFAPTQADYDRAATFAAQASIAPEKELADLKQRIADGRVSDADIALACKEQDLSVEDFHEQLASGTLEHSAFRSIEKSWRPLSSTGPAQDNFAKILRMVDEGRIDKFNLEAANLTVPLKLNDPNLTEKVAYDLMNKGQNHTTTRQREALELLFDMGVRSTGVVNRDNLNEITGKDAAAFIDDKRGKLNATQKEQLGAVLRGTDRVTATTNAAEAANKELDKAIHDLVGKINQSAVPIEWNNARDRAFKVVGATKTHIIAVGDPQYSDYIALHRNDVRDMDAKEAMDRVDGWTSDLTGLPKSITVAQGMKQYAGTLYADTHNTEPNVALAERSSKRTIGNGQLADLRKDMVEVPNTLERSNGVLASVEKPSPWGDSYVGVLFREHNEVTNQQVASLALVPANACSNSSELLKTTDVALSTGDNGVKQTRTQKPTLSKAGRGGA